MSWTVIKAYLLNRAQEPSTWRGIVLLSTVVGYKISEEWQELIALVGIGIAGFLGAVLPDRKGP